MSFWSFDSFEYFNRNFNRNLKVHVIHIGHIAKDKLDFFLPKKREDFFKVETFYN